ncbi:hypothetical protein AVEN_164685-1 [Araneus ventricosus]|uniref:Uncharacterized protein n=1 Tax=Araneus ventricosus TaxID=182803 RepID=A0A4Y1ZRD5_ARAVE|nr:hypothetical protein AVEN_192637-1 [Araneus ventricosus]GBL63078.1 hypothetical protein AVEN_35184-1 [Araneus ventricosus]GBL63105.1 hypothetical protein AVEN_92182-1 [Araneus ventricosus]GBL63144.1 hypothetical protein AVEN_164685-1 [Araneus ventricosus]
MILSSRYYPSGDPGRGGLVVRSRNPGRRVLGSKPDSTEEPPSPLTPWLFGRMRNELESPNLSGHLPHNPTPAITVP